MNLIKYPVTLLNDRETAISAAGIIDIKDSKNVLIGGIEIHGRNAEEVASNAALIYTALQRSESLAS